MKKIALITALSLSSLSAFAGPCTSSDLERAAEFHDFVVALYEAGAATTHDLNVAKTALFDVKYCTGEMTLQEYCAEKSTILEAILKKLTYHLKAGQTSIERNSIFLKELVELRTRCAVEPQ